MGKDLKRKQVKREEKHIKGNLFNMVTNLLYGFYTLQEVRSLRFFLYLIQEQRYEQRILLNLTIFHNIPIYQFSINEHANFHEQPIRGKHPTYLVLIK